MFDKEEERAPQTSPILVVVCGLQGTGKSSVGEHISNLIPSVLFRSDVVRKDLFPQPTYTEKEMQMVYKEVFIRARESLASGNSVILDATFKTEDNRSEARQIAKDLGVNFCLLEVVVENDNDIKDRMRLRKNDASDALFEHYLKTKDSFKPVEGAITINNSGSLEETLIQVEQTIISVTQF